MAEPRFSSMAGMDTDDDLPRTLRRERDAQARRAREHELLDAPQGTTPPPIASEAPPFQAESYDYDDLDPAPATVTRLDIPFFHLMFFCLKAVVAAIPALILLVGILWLFGEVLTATFPELLKVKILIGVPN